MELCLIGIVLGRSVPAFPRSRHPCRSVSYHVFGVEILRSVPKCPRVSGCRSVLWPKCPVTCNKSTSLSSNQSWRCLNKVLRGVSYEQAWTSVTNCSSLILQARIALVITAVYATESSLVNSVKAVKQTSAASDEVSRQCKTIWQTNQLVCHRRI